MELSRAAFTLPFPFNTGTIGVAYLSRELNRKKCSYLFHVLLDFSMQKELKLKNLATTPSYNVNSHEIYKIFLIPH